MKVFVLTHCAAGKNYTPKVFADKETAIKNMKELYEDCISVRDFVEINELYETNAVIIYIDDTYDRFNIFEVNLE
mgnify:CR=1 FL=1